MDENVVKFDNQVGDKKHTGAKWLKVAGLIILELLIITGVFYLGAVWGKNRTADQNPSNIQPTPTSKIIKVDPSPVIETEKYQDPVQQISFEYPKDWQFKRDPGMEANGETYNTQISLTKKDAVINMYLNMDGIGGLGKNLEGIPFKLDGHDLYQYTDTMPEISSKVVGLTNSLTNSLGVFDVNDITYSIVLTYPSRYETDQTEIALQTEFDLILSTFKFVD